ncbi:hypothetical protein [uncultured Pseudodesulfovibrio sp.]|uniref:hypothetical protein n=1 Tax=uncultured Pseudodesulfovibrio sp. TaxID=2035858 RepID=UPI0029C71F0F|nr:hypothetical protein [uncultured Pseudodesulfovibrio sp.]
MLKKIELSVLAMFTFAIIIFGATTLSLAQTATTGKHASLPHDAIDIAIDTRCNLYTACRESGHVFCIPPNSEAILLGKISETPAVLTVDALRNVFVGTENGGIYLITQDGDLHEVCRIDRKPIGLEMDRDGTLLVGTSHGRIIRVTRSELQQIQEKN